MSISIEELNRMNPDSYQIIDIRDEAEIGHGAIPGAVAVATEEIEGNEKIDFSISKEDFNTLCSSKIERMIKEAHTNIKIIKKHLEEDEENREFHIELINNQKNKIQSAKILEETKKDILKNWDNIGYLQAINKIDKWFLFGQNK